MADVSVTRKIRFSTRLSRSVRVFAVTAIWMLAAMVVAVRQALDYEGTAKAGRFAASVGCWRQRSRSNLVWRSDRRSLEPADLAMAPHAQVVSSTASMWSSI